MFHKPVDDVPLATTVFYIKVWKGFASGYMCVMGVAENREVKTRKTVNLELLVFMLFLFCVL